MALPDRHPPPEETAADPLRFLTEAALAHGDILAILPDVVSCIRRELGADLCSVLLAGEAHRSLTVSATSGSAKSGLRSGLRFPLDGEVVALLVDTHRPLILGGGHPLGDLLRQAAPHHLIAPLVVDSRLLGIVLIGAGQRFSPAAAGTLQELSDRVALALDHARLYRAERVARSEAVRTERTLRATEKLAATGRLAASIAHEINNPMASVTNLLYLLQHHTGLDATATEYIKLAQEELHRVTHIVRQMLGFYRESEAPIPVDLKDVIDNVLILYARRLQNTRMVVDRQFRTQATIRGFPGEIRQVFSNLIVNSIEAVGDAGRIRIDVRSGRDWSKPEVQGVRVLVADNGPGISEDARRHIFEPFFTTKGERGTGLGLWVSEGIVRKHGGSIRVRSCSSERRHGTCFSVFFPLESVEMKRP